MIFCIPLFSPSPFYLFFFLLSFCIRHRFTFVANISLGRSPRLARCPESYEYIQQLRQLAKFLGAANVMQYCYDAKEHSSMTNGACSPKVQVLNCTNDISARMWSCRYTVGLLALPLRSHVRRTRVTRKSNSFAFKRVSQEYIQRRQKLIERVID